MNDTTFDLLSKRLAARPFSRRAALASLVAAALGLVAGRGLAGPAEAAHKRGKKKKKKKPPTCTPACANRECGDDGCGGSCGRCNTGAVCSSAGTCDPACTPDCANKDCGSDGCGGACGSCTNGFTCASNRCTCASGACGGVCCPTNQTCVAGSCCPNGKVCNGTCCASTQTCVGNACCATGRVCGNACCQSGETCIDNSCCPGVRVCNGVCCPANQPCLGNQCCPAARVCGAACCAANQTCINNACCPASRTCAGTCCAAGSTCIGSQCCPDTRVCGGACCAAGQSCVNNACQAGPALDSEESAFLTLINTYRVQNGRGALTAQSQLTAAAERHSQDQAAHNFSGHTGSDGSTIEQRITATGYPWTAWGENVYWNSGDGSASAAFTWWKNSSIHNANMLSANFTEIGISRVRASNGTWYWTTDFGDR